MKSSILDDLDRTGVDTQLLPFIDRVNALPYALTIQCCTGHMPYRLAGRKVPPKHLPRRSSGRWGYLQLAIPYDVAKWTHEIARRDNWEEWIWVYGSQIYAVGARTVERFTDIDGVWVSICFAWDAKHWPRPAEDVCLALETYPGPIRRRH